MQRDSEHLFFKLGDFEEMLRGWTGSGRLQPAVSSKLAEWFTAGLRDWDISRDEPYFGFQIPGETGKYFYVWLDAPIGYLSSLLNYCRRNGRDFDRYWNPDSDCRGVSLHRQGHRLLPHAVLAGRADRRGFPRARRRSLRTAS